MLNWNPCRHKSQILELSEAKQSENRKEAAKEWMRSTAKKGSKRNKIEILWSLHNLRKRRTEAALATPRTFQKRQLIIDKEEEELKTECPYATEQEVEQQLNQLPFLEAYLAFFSPQTPDDPQGPEQLQER